MNDRHILRRDALLADLDSRPLIMGVLNVTPDSFSDGGRYLEPELAHLRAAAMATEGADIIDVGGESTRPGASEVSETEERGRVESVVARICGEVARPVSIDTYKANVARAAAMAGAVVINDVWGMTRDPEMACAVAETQSLIVVTYNRGKADAALDLLDDMRDFFDAAFAMASRAGIPYEHVILDPGIGFAKTYEQNLEALGRLDALLDYRRPILVGASRKSFLGRLTGQPVDQRLTATLTAGVAAVLCGASILRVHDVAAHREAFAVLDVLGRYT